MKDDPNPDEFGLDVPSEEFKNLKSNQGKSSSKSEKSSMHDSYVSAEKHLHDAEIKYKAMGWKGVDEEDEEIPEEDIPFATKKAERNPDDEEMDMTPMVDVTFLLLIFFMVTASFTMQKALEQPKAKSEEPTANPIDEPEILEDYIEIVIDQNNNFYVTTRAEAEQEAPSDRELRAIVKDAKENSSAARLIIKAHLDCKHSKVITAWDAGVMVGLTDIELKTTEQDY